MFCEKCGTEIPKGAKFCEKCGSRIEPDIQEGEEDSSHKKWIIGGIIGGIAVVAVVVVALFATGVFGGKDDVVQTSTDGGMQSDMGVLDATAQPTEQPTATPVITPSPTPEPTEVPVESEDTDNSDIQTDNDVLESDNEGNSEYIFPNSDSEYLTELDVKKLSASKINLAKNELYARHGRKFDREDLQEYFEGCSWYSPVYTAKEWDKYGDAYFFNKYEIKNRNLLKKWENKKKK